MAINRIGVRNLVMGVISQFWRNGPVVASRSYSPEKGESEFIKVYLLEGEKDGPHLTNDIGDQLVIAYLKKSIKKDEELDVVADEIIQALRVNHTLGDHVDGIVYNGYQYPDYNRTEYASILLSFTVIREGD